MIRASWRGTGRAPALLASLALALALALAVVGVAAPAAAQTRDEHCVIIARR